MTFDWNIPIGTILLGIAQIYGLIKAYFGLKADNASLSTELKADNAKVSSKLDLSMLTVRAEMREEYTVLRDAIRKEHTTDQQAIVGLVSKVEISVSDLNHRVTTLEGGQDEWTKSLRTRMHELSNQVNTLVLKVDRLERPGRDA
jgi:hypothetical protein